ncbi:MAG: sulfatase-like hydrolase/transferase, partial [Thermoanaerobaculia bacterium]
MRIFIFFLLTPFFVFPLDENQMEKIAIEKVLKKDFEGALKIYEELYKKNPEKPSILQNLSNLYILLKKEDKAEEVLKNLIKTEPEKSYAYKILRLLMMKKGKFLEWQNISAEWYTKTKNEESLKALIGAIVRTGNFSQAIKLMKKNRFQVPELEEIKENTKIKNLIFLITLDTFRFDLIGKNVTPNLIKLIDESYFFKNAYSVSPITLPAHCSIFTGLSPRHNGVKDNSIYRLKDEAETLPEILKNYGYNSYAFISSYLLNRRFGLDQGFKAYQDNFIPLDKKKHFPSTRRAFDTISEAIKFLNNLKEEKAFFFIHLYDTHAPYEPPFPFDEAYPESPYKGEASYMDFVLGNFLNLLKKAKLYEKSMIIVISDHGESLGENGEPTHGFLLYEPTLHIPFILHLPEQKIKKEMDTMASQVDILPTILSILKIKYKKLDGENLFNLKDEREIFSET